MFNLMTLTIATRIPLKKMRALHTYAIYICIYASRGINDSRRLCKYRAVFVSYKKCDRCESAKKNSFDALFAGWTEVILIWIKKQIYAPCNSTTKRILLTHPCPHAPRKTHARGVYNKQISREWVCGCVYLFTHHAHIGYTSISAKLVYLMRHYTSTQTTSDTKASLVCQRES